MRETTLGGARRLAVLGVVGVLGLGARQGEAVGQIGSRNAVVMVTVNSHKADGNAWDAFGGAPDIALCVNSAFGQRCYANGAGVVNAPSDFVRGRCQDSFSCSFPLVVPTSGPYSITIWDVDLSAHDVIGSCIVSRPGTTGACGNAQITTL